MFRNGKGNQRRVQLIGRQKNEKKEQLSIFVQWLVYFDLNFPAFVTQPN